MQYLEVEIPENVGYLIPIGCLHLGDRNFTSSSLILLKGYLNWVRDTPNARIFFLGDLFNVAGRDTRTSPFDSETDDCGIVNELEEAVKLFKPYAGQIVGAIEGNHEARLLDKYGISLTQNFCREINIAYCKWSAVVCFKIHKRSGQSNEGRWHQNYWVYFHHTTGGGATLGGKINRVEKLRNIVEGMDVYCGGHNHQLISGPQEVFYPSFQGGIRKRRIWFVDCGSYLEWDGGYAEKGMMTPTKLGSPRIRFEGGRKRDVHVNQ